MVRTLRVTGRAASHALGRRGVVLALVAAFLLLAACGSGGGQRAPLGPTPTPPSIEVEIGQFAYAQEGCAGCHGARAEGGLGRPLAGVSVSRIERAVRSGPGRMPAYTREQLGDAQLDQIIQFIEWITAR